MRSGQVDTKRLERRVKGLEARVQLGVSSHVRAATSASGTYGNGAVIQYATVQADELGEYENSTWNFTAKSEGFFLISAAVLIDYIAYLIRNSVQLHVRKNGTSVAWGSRAFAPSAANWYLSSAVVTTLKLKVGDVVDIVVSHDRGGNLVLYPALEANYLSIDRID